MPQARARPVSVRRCDRHRGSDFQRLDDEIAPDLAARAESLTPWNSRLSELNPRKAHQRPGLERSLRPLREGSTSRISISVDFPGNRDTEVTGRSAKRRRLVVRLGVNRSAPGGPSGSPAWMGHKSARRIFSKKAAVRR